MITAFLFLHAAVRPISNLADTYRLAPWQRLWRRTLKLAPWADAEAERENLLLAREEPWVLAQKDPFSECGVRKD